jgi:hypothetical protein
MQVMIRGDTRGKNYANETSKCESVPETKGVACQQHRLSNKKTGKHCWNETYNVSAENIQ